MTGDTFSFCLSLYSEHTALEKNRDRFYRNIFARGTEKKKGNSGAKISFFFFVVVFSSMSFSEVVPFLFSLERTTTTKTMDINNFFQSPRIFVTEVIH